MSVYYVEPTLRDTEAEPKYTFAEVKWGKIVAIHHHWVPLDEFYKYFEANAFFVDITDVIIDGEAPAIGDSVTNDPNEGYKIIHIRNTYTKEERKQYKIEVLKLIRNQKELEVIKYNDIPFDADTISQTRMEKARTFLEDNPSIPSITWTAADNSRVEVTVDDFKEINTLIALRSNNLHVRYNKLKWYILNTDLDDEELESIDWDFDIPSTDVPNSDPFGEQVDSSEELEQNQEINDNLEGENSNGSTDNEVDPN